MLHLYYDAAGNQNTKETYEYDAVSNVTAITSVTGARTEYTYDHAGNRTSKTVNEEETQYYVVDINGSLSQVNAKVTADGTVIASHVRGEDLISMEADGKVWYYVADGHGSIRALIDEEGNITDSYSYDAFGNVLTKEGDTENDYRYTGEEYNELTGLYYLRARYMDPSTGTFISMDSYPGRMNDPVSLHKYLYANANPVMNTDPTGYFSFGECSAVTAMQDVIKGISINLSLHRIMALAETVCVVYDVVMIIRDVIFGEGSILDIMRALTTGVAVGYVLDYLCAGPLGLVLRPMFIALGFRYQFQQVMEAIKSGDALEITMQILEMTVMAYDVTRQGHLGEGKDDRYSNLDEGLNFANTPATHMEEPERYVPVQIMQEAIKCGEALPDPKGSDATMYYTTIYKHGKLYNLEILYDELTNTVLHFKYTRDAIGNLPKIKK